MGNTSCRYSMKNDLRKESALYQNSKLLYFVSAFAAWYLYIRHHYDGIDKWYIMPITAYVTAYFILGTLIYICTEMSMDKYELNNRIYKCIQWQQNNKNLCDTKKFGKCVIDPNKVKEWNPTPPKPVENTENKEKFTFDYYKPSTHILPNFSLATEQSDNVNIPVKSSYSTTDIKPGNYYL